MGFADEIFERSKDDRAMIVGGEIRGAIQEVRDERDELRKLLVEAFPYVKKADPAPEELLQKIRDVMSRNLFKPS
jgi:hypothetical protein